MYKKIPRYYSLKTKLIYAHMKSRLKQKISFITYFSYLAALSFIYRFRAGFALPGKEFDWYGRKLAFAFLLKKDAGRFFRWLCNPVSSVRYFEFPFVVEAGNWQKANFCLDISSPRLYLIYLVDKYPHLQLEVLNPDIYDLEETAAQVKTLKLVRQISFVSDDATRLPYSDNSFDLVTSISVIEHISSDGDSLAIKEMWRVLKPGGKLIITVPCAKLYYEEWREKDFYHLGNEKKDGKYFFQRFYDKSSLKLRLLDSIGIQPTSVKIFGEKVPGTFDSYIQRWINLGLQETVKDSFYIARDYKYFDDIDLLPGVGICGLAFEKA